MTHLTSDSPKPLVAVAWHHRHLVLSIAVAATTLGIAYTRFSTPIWEASTTIVFPARTPSVLGTGSLTEQGTLTAALTGGPTPLKIYKGFLESERALKFVSDASGMKRKEVFTSRKIVDQTMENSLTISVRLADGLKAREIVQAHLDALAKINQEVSEPLYEDDAIVLGKKLAEQKARVSGIEEQLLNFQQISVTAPTVSAAGNGKESTVVPAPAHWQELQRELEIGISKVNANIQAVRNQIQRASGKSGDLPSNLPPVRKWRDKLVEQEYDLKIKELTYAPESPEIQEAREQAATTRANLKQELAAYTKAIETGAIDPTAGEGGLAGLMTERFGLEAQLAAVRRLNKLAPGESIALSRLTRELTTQSGILQQVQAQFELAKIQEMRNPNKWQILDEPEIAEEPVNKSYTKTGVVSMLFGLILGLLIALGQDSKRTLLKNAVVEERILEKVA